MTEAKYTGVPEGDTTDVPLVEKEAGADDDLIVKTTYGEAAVRILPWKKYLMTVWAVVECMLFGGLVYGWGSLVFVLKQEGIYAGLCHRIDNSSLPILNSANDTDSSEGSCPAQDKKLSLVFTVATTLMTFSSPLMGHIQYTFGTRVARIVLILFLLVGSLVTAFLDTSTPYLLFIAMSCLAIGGLPVLVTNIQVANLFVLGGSTVVGMLSGAFDVSAAIQLMVKIAYENGISRQISYVFIACLLVMMVISTFFLLPKTILPKAEAPPEKDTGTDAIESSTKGNGTNGGLVSDCEKPLTRGDVPSLMDCALSPVFLSHVGWLSILQLRFYYFLSSFNPWLNFITKEDEDLVSHYTNASLFIQMAGILTSLFCGFILDLEKRRNKGKRSVTERRLQPSVVPQGLTSILALLLSVMVLVPFKEVLYVDFIILTMFRSFMYGMAAAFTQMVFPAEYFGFLYGVMIVIGGLVGFLQYCLFMWMEAPPKGPQKVNIFLLVLMLVSLLHPLHIWLRCRAADKRAQKRKEVDSESEYVFISPHPFRK